MSCWQCRLPSGLCGSSSSSGSTSSSRRRSSSSSISRVSDQIGVSLLYIMLEIHHSGWEPSILYLNLFAFIPIRSTRPSLCLCLYLFSLSAGLSVYLPPFLSLPNHSLPPSLSPCLSALLSLFLTPVFFHSPSLHSRLEITVPVGWALNSNN